MSSFLHDIQYALRLLRKSPGFSSAAVAALALGVGANTAIFSVVNSVILRPFPYPDAKRMVVVWENSLGQGWNRIGPSGPNFLDFRDQSRSFDDMALIEPGTGTLTGFGEPMQLPGIRVTTNFLSLLGVRPELGRDFQRNEGWSQRVVIISHGVWDRFFGLDPNVIGKRAIADGLSYTVIGVLPRDFWSPVPGDVLVPWVDADLRSRPRMDHHYGVIGRLKPGVSVQQATADLGAIERRIGEQFIGMKDWGVTLVPLQEVLVQNVRTSLFLLLGAVALVLLIACANLANLLLARAAGRGRESAVRMALGAGRSRLVRQFLTESGVLGLIGGALGLLLALWGTDFMERIIPRTIRLPEAGGELLRPHIVVDAWVLLFTLLVSVATSLIFGLAPAFAGSKTDLQAALKEGGRGASAGGARLRGIFAGSEIAFALVLLICSALTIKSFWRIHGVDPGFAADRVLALEMELPTDSKYRTAAEQAEFFRRVLENARSLPGVRSAGVTCVLPLDGEEDERTEFLIEGRPPLPSGQTLPADSRSVSADYFAAMGIPLRQGRVFSEQDKAGRPAVTAISESLARRYWPDGTDPIGQRLRLHGAVHEIVGIVADVKHSGLDKQAPPTVYTSYLQSPRPRMTLVVRAALEPASMITAVKQAVYTVDKDQPVFKVRTMDQVIANSQSSTRLTLVLLGIFAGIALILAAAGIYGVVSYTVAQRTREIGIRVALGAQERDVLRLVARQGLMLSLVGVGLGLAGAFAVTRLISGILFGVSATDAGIYTAAAVLLAGVALLASYVPARRAMRVDPVVVLRYE